MAKINFFMSYQCPTFVTNPRDMAMLFEDYDRDKKNMENGKIIGQISPEVGKRRFLELYVETCHFHKTCQILGLVPRTVYHWLHNDPQFKEDYELTKGFAITVLEDEATRRALYGVEEPVYQGGKKVGYIRRYSDTLLIVLLKGMAPDKYRENWKGTLTDGQGNPIAGNKITINHIHTDAKTLATSEEEIEIEIKKEGGAPGQPPATQDIDYEMLPPSSSSPDDLIDHAK